MKVLRKLGIVFLVLAILAAFFAGAVALYAASSDMPYIEAVKTVLDTFIDTEDLFEDSKTEEKGSQQAQLQENMAQEVLPVTFSLDQLPAWNGQTASVPVNNNVPVFPEEMYDYTMAFISYSDLDLLGRCQSAAGVLGTEILPEDIRDDEEERMSVTPTGYKQKKYDPQLVDQEYLYNRCHLIGWQLGGDANKLNLVTGTRYMNVDGMLPYENMVAQYLYDNPQNHVLYQVSPVFYSVELTCRGVFMQAYSLEDEGKLSFAVFCYNEQPGITISHLDGESFLTQW